MSTKIECGGYNLRKRNRDVEENSVKKRMKAISRSESSDEDFSSENFSSEDFESSGDDSEDNSIEIPDDSSETDPDENSDDSEESTDEEEIHPSVFRILGHGYRGKGFDDVEERNEFFEPDTSDLTNELGNYLMDKFSDLGLPKKELKKAIERSMKRAREDVFDEYCDSKPRDKRWKVGVDKETVKELEPELKRLRLNIENEKPTMLKILMAKIPRKDKEMALQLFNLLENVEQYSEERICLEKRISGLLESEKVFGDNVEYYEKEEEKIKELVGDYNKFLKKKIFDLDASDDVKSKIYEMYLDLMDQRPDSSEYCSIKAKINWAVSLPHRKMVEPKDTLEEIRSRLDGKILGLEHVKERITEIVNNRRSNPKTKSMIGLKGPPGVGKTLCAKALAESFDPPLPFEHISLGGLEDPSVLRGSESTWVGSSPSIILHILRKMKCNNGIIFLDEIDKLGGPDKSSRGAQVQYALLHIVDYTNNKEFQDLHLSEFTHDFSNIWWILGMNDDTWIDPILRSRLDIITIEPYKNKEKVKIITDFMIPEILKDIGLAEGSVKISDHACDCLIMLLSEQMNKGDLRPMKKELNRIISRLHMLDKNFQVEESQRIKLSYSINNFSGLPHTLTSTDIERLWTNPKINTDYLRMYG
jgi:ATP-dependent Lon protease